MKLSYTITEDVKKYKDFGHSFVKDGSKVTFVLSFDDNQVALIYSFSTDADLVEGEYQNLSSWGSDWAGSVENLKQFQEKFPELVASMPKSIRSSEIEDLKGDVEYHLEQSHFIPA